MQDSNIKRDGLEIVPALPTPPVRPEVETEQELRHAAEKNIRNLMHYAKGSAGHVPVSGYAIEVRDKMIETHEDKRDVEIKWEELTKALGAHGPESDALTGSDTNDDIHQRALRIIHESQVVAGEALNSKELPHVPEADFGNPAPTYPPDESEWPEKPDAGEGMVWERVKPGEKLDHFGSYLALILFGSKGGVEWREWTCPAIGITQTEAGTVLMKAVPAPQWRELGPNEVIQEGDEVRNSRDTEWFPAIDSIGTPLQEWIDRDRGFRARTRRPLPPSEVVDPVSGVTVPAELLPLPAAPKGKIAVARGWGWDSKIDVIYTRKSKKDLTKWDGWAPTPQTTLADEDAFYFEAIAPPAERKAREWTLTRHAEECSITVCGPQIEVGKSVTVREEEP